MLRYSLLPLAFAAGLLLACENRPARCDLGQSQILFAFFALPPAALSPEREEREALRYLILLDGIAKIQDCPPEE